MNALQVATPPAVATVMKWCWQHKGRVPEDRFAVARCIDCTAAGHRDSTIRLARQYLRGAMFSDPARRRQVVYRMLARSVERQAALEGIEVSLGEPDFGVRTVAA